VLVIIGVVGEAVSEGKLSTVDTKLRAHDEQILTDATITAGSANDSAQAAAGAATQANTAAGLATVASGKATGAAGNALTLANDARKEADSFEKDIVSAKQQATDAELHQAEALRQATEATAELNRIKTPRSLTRVSELISALEPFTGTEYVFVSVFQDAEAINLLRTLNDVLQKAGWKRGKSVGGFPGINVYGKDVPDFTVPVGFNIGIQISADSPEPLESLQSLQTKDLPQYLQAGTTLNAWLSSGMFPPNENSIGGKVSIEKGTSLVIRIAVGRKP
jgi:hypothetical protein